MIVDMKCTSHGVWCFMAAFINVDAPQNTLDDHVNVSRLDPSIPFVIKEPGSASACSHTHTVLVLATCKNTQYVYIYIYM